MGICRWLRVWGVVAGALATAATGVASNAPHQALRPVAGFEEPLVPTGPAAEPDQAALDSAVAALETSHAEGLMPLLRYLERYPDGVWALSVQTNLGLWYYREGYFSKAIAAWEAAWRVGQAAGPQLPAPAKALADRAVGELIRMHARLGHAQRLKALLAEVEGRVLVGPATELVAGARQGLWMMDNNPGVAYLCGPNALRRLALLKTRSDAPQVKLLDRYRSGDRGVSLAQVSELAKAAKMPYRPVYREGAARIPVPSLVHWKVQHYAAIVGEDGGRYHIQDPTFGTDLWVSRDALEQESSGYFLIADSAPRAGWREVSAAEGQSVHGMGFTNSGDPNATRPEDPKVEDPPCEGCTCNHGMCGYNAHSMNVSLNLMDTPVGYRPAVGPPVFVQLIYNQREARQPAVPTFFNLGPKWTSNWLGYVVDVPNRPGVSVMSYVRGGGAYDELGYSSSSGEFYPEPSNYSVLRLVSSSPVQYERRFKDGSSEIYASPDGASVYPRRVFLTRVVDPQGNAVSLGYDAGVRLLTLTDAVGQVTSFTYGSAAFPLQPTRITDPFGRFASLAYDVSGRLQGITDVLGLISTMTYDAGSFINKMTTPYGDSSFAYTENGPDRSLNITDPLGYTSRVESRHGAPGLDYADPRGMPAGMADANQYLYYRNTFYWDRHAYSLAAGDYTLAKVQHWYHDMINGSYSSAAMSSIKQPLEGRVWLHTPNDSGLSSGTYNAPWQTGRVLDDGSSQVTTVQYNKAGNVGARTDPEGRYTQYTYAAGGIDITRMRQRGRNGIYYTVAEYTYNSQHLPLSYTDAAGQTTSYTYNAAGQLTSRTNALNQTSRYEYNALGQLTRVVNSNNKTVQSMTYDAPGRVATRTDSEGRVVSYSYDAMDRLTGVSYMDGTAETFGYYKLERSSYKDRQGRTSAYGYDANRRLVSRTDPLLRTTSFGYYRNGLLMSITDPKGQATSWQRDLQGRAVGKTFADGSAETYAWETFGGRLRSTSDASGRTRTYSYRRGDQIASIAYSGGPVAAATVQFTYDLVFSRVTAMADATGKTRYAYAGVGTLGALQMTLEDGPFANDEVGYAYDELGRVKQRSVAGDVENVVYDALGRVLSGQNALGSPAYTYRGETRQLASQAIGTKAKTSFTYEGNAGDRRLKAIANLGTRRFNYTTNARGLVTSIADTDLASPPAARTWTPTYDAAERLNKLVLSAGGSYEYGYDDADNIGSFKLPGGTFAATYGSTNQMTKLGAATVVHDAAGNTTEDGQRTYAWDAAGRLAAIGYKAQPGLKSEFRYDGLGRRVAIVETASGTVTETRYLWCGAKLCQARDGADTVTRRYFREGEYRPLANTRSYYNRDRLGSVRNVTGVAAGNLLASLDFDAYGNLTQGTGNTSASDFRYAGMFYHPTSGLYLTWYRPYDANASRWLSRDPIFERGGPFLYGYVGSNPFNFTDPLGLYTPSSYGDSARCPQQESDITDPPTDSCPAATWTGENWFGEQMFHDGRHVYKEVKPAGQVWGAECSYKDGVLIEGDEYAGSANLFPDGDPRHLTQDPGGPAGKGDTIPYDEHGLIKPVP